MPVASMRPFMNKEADNEIYSEMGQSAKSTAETNTHERRIQYKPLFMPTKVIKLFGYSYFFAD